MQRGDRRKRPNGLAPEGRTDTGKQQQVWASRRGAPRASRRRELARQYPLSLYRDNLGPPYSIFEYISRKGEGDLSEFRRRLQTKLRARLDDKIRMLREQGSAVSPKLLAGPVRGYPRLYKLRVYGDVQLRPVLCKGPVNMEREFTFLRGAIEKGGKLVPSNAYEIAVERREIVKSNPRRRRSYPHHETTA